MLRRPTSRTVSDCRPQTLSPGPRLAHARRDGKKVDHRKAKWNLNFGR